MADASEDWAIEHVKDQTYDVVSLLGYDAKDVVFEGPNVAVARIDFGGGAKIWRKTYEIIEAGAYVHEHLTPRLTGQPSTFRLEISWTDAKGDRRSGTYTIPQPGRTRPDLRSSFPPGLATRASQITATRASKPAEGVGTRQYAVSVPTPNPKDIFVVHGRNEAARSSMFAFLRAIGLNPIEWNKALAATGSASPYIGEVLDTAFDMAQAIVVLMTPDELAHLLPDYASGPSDPETTPGPQARPNVLFEAGMAMGRDPKRTVLVELGMLRPFSDVAGRHAVRLNDTPEKRLDLANRLRTAGCDVDTSGTDWLTAGDFSAPKV